MKPRMTRFAPGVYHYRGFLIKSRGRKWIVWTWRTIQKVGEFWSRKSAVEHIDRLLEAK